MSKPDTPPTLADPLNVAVINPPPGAAALGGVSLLQAYASIMQALNKLRETMEITAGAVNIRADVRSDLSTKLQPLQDCHNQVQRVAHAFTGQPELSENAGVSPMGGGPMLLLLAEPRGSRRMAVPPKIPG